MTEERLKELERAKKVARSKLANIEYQRNETIRLERIDVERRVKEQFSNDIHAAQVAYDAAKSAYDEARVEFVQSGGADLPYPVGTKLRQWKYPRFSYNAKMQSTDTVAVVEIFTKKSQCPENMGWRRPKPGDIVLRHLKKNGKPGIRVTPWEDTDWMRREWKPDENQ